MNVAAPVEIDPTMPCELCGCLIEDFETLIYVRAAELAAQWEGADPRDRWRPTGAPPPRALDVPSAPARPYRPPQATIDAFRYLVRLGDQQRLSNWLKDHPADAPALLKLLEQA
jgi:hypothetical protein